MDQHACVLRPRRGCFLWGSRINVCDGGCHLRDINPELSAASPSQTSYCMWLFLKLSLLMTPLNWQVLPLFMATLLHVQLLLYFAGNKVWRLAKTCSPTFSIIGNFVSVLSADLSLALFHPLPPYFLLCHFLGCLCGWPIRLFEFLFPIKSRAHQLWRVTSAQQEGSKRCKTEILRGS